MTSKADLILAKEYVEKTRELIRDNPYHMYMDLHLNTVYWELDRQITNLNVTNGTK
tara:strand:+ start:202 stop:369 length:168 start_codon:yes stop_codon:yes gene_type:complete